MFDATAGVLRSTGSPAVFYFTNMDKYSGTTPSGRKVIGRLEVEDGISYIVTDDDIWYMVHTSTVRKEDCNG